MNYLKSKKEMIKSLLKVQSLIRGASVVVALLGVSLASSQTTYPTYQGTNQRQGQNLNPADNPGVAALNWFFPLGGIGQLATLLRDNNSSEASFVGGWASPLLGNEASGFFIAPNTGNAAQNLINGTIPYPPYYYSTVVPSNLSGDPRVPLAGVANVFTWQFTPPTNTPQDYALSVWLPTGPTTDAVLGPVYPQRYFVYEVDYGTNQTFVDVVDRDESGGGFVRLGNGGLPTNALFHYDGLTPIKIKLFNTVPRDSKGNLIGVSVNSNGTLQKNFLVYADAAEAVPNNGEYDAQPIIATDPTDLVSPVRVFAPINNNVVTQQNGSNIVQQQGVLDALKYSNATIPAAVSAVWQFSPVISAGDFVTLDNPNPGVVASPAWTTVATPANGAYNLGPDYFTTPVTNTAVNEAQVTYTPTLADGTYLIYMWMPGVQAANYAKAVQVEVDEGATVSTFIVNLASTNGYVAIGTRKFTNSVAAPLVFKITNLDTQAADAGLPAYADAVKFVGAFNLAINSTPVYANVPIAINANGSGSTTVNTNVVVVAGEDGRIYCLDAKGNADGTTNVYWAYPTIPSSTPDPNINGGPDGVNNTTLAIMPTGFNTSSALIQEVPVGSGNFFLYIASSNGRVYCINMTGRGDNNVSLKQPGTTNRVWTYPDDYPATPQVSNLGSFTGSLVYHTNANGPTIFVPAPQGRMYALDAAGNNATHVTTVKWEYPLITQPALGPIAMTPSIDGVLGNDAAIYFGTEMNNGVTPGAFYSLDTENGNVNYAISQPDFDSFDGGVATAFNNAVGDGRNYIFASNRNGNIYAFDDLGNVLWATSELNTTTSVPLSFTNINVFNNTGVIGAQTSPIVMVPTDDGNFYGLYAAQGTLNSSGFRLAYGYTAQGSQIKTPMALAQNYMVGTDNLGYLYAFGNGASVSGVGGAPGAPVGVPNDPASQQFQNAKIAFLTPAAYKALRQDPNPNYATYIQPSSFENRVPNAFDFGETLYPIVYDYPYTNPNGGAPPVLNFTFTVEGNTFRTVSVGSLQFQGAPSANEDGYAVLSFPVQSAGINSLTPGSGSITFQISAEQSNGTTENFFLENPNTRINFYLANPIGIALMPDLLNPNYGLAKDSLGSDLASFSSPSSGENLFNGANTAGDPAPLPNGFIPASLITSTGFITNGNTGSAGSSKSFSDGTPSRPVIAVYDRSLLSLLNGPDIGGLTNIRVNRNAMSWQGGYGAVVKPIGGANGLYPGMLVLNTFETYPVNYPNTSLDYPDIQADSLVVTKEPNGNTENPVFGDVTLEIPNGLFAKDADGNWTNALASGNYASRTPVPTPFEFDVNVPRYQPANGSTTLDTLGLSVDDGYLSRVNVFADSTGSGNLDLNNGRRDAFRTFLLGSGVDVDEKLNVITPNVDLGSLAGGTGLFPAASITPNSVYSPWGALNQPNIYQSFQVLNEGNVNMLNLRLAHSSNNGNNYSPWPFYSAGNDNLGFVDGTVSMYSDLDPFFAPSNLGGVLPRGEVLGQKSRVTDGSGFRVLTNPISRLTGLALSPNYPSQDPRIAITPPIGFPVGQYYQFVRVIEDRSYQAANPLNPPGYDLSLDLNNEVYSDPTLNVSFTVRETRLTNTNTQNVSIMADNLVPNGWNGQPIDSNVQPAASRDLFGDLLTAWSSNRPTSANGLLATTTNGDYRLYFGKLLGTTPAAANKGGLSDLAGFKSGVNSQWFNTAGPYPIGPSTGSVAMANALFGAGASEHVVGTVNGESDTATFGNPSFPSMGQVDPYDETQSFGTMLMSFTGSAQVTGPTQVRSVNKLFVSAVTIDQNAAPTVSAPVALAGAGNQDLSKPSVVQTGNDQGLVFYGTAGTGADHIFYTPYINGAFGTVTTLDLGQGFESATGPSVSARNYTGGDKASVATNGKIIDLIFSGKLRGRLNNEIFMARMPTDAQGNPDASNSTNSQLSYFSPITDEALINSDTTGIYRSNGVIWNPGSPIILTIGGQAFDVTATGVQDASNGIWSVTTSLGRTYLDPTVGTVRFASAVPGPKVVVSLSYQPAIIRISSESTSGFTRPSLVWDNKLVGSTNYSNTGLMADRAWYEPGGVFGNLSDNNLRDARYVVSYDRASAGNGQSAHPMLGTMRLGINFPALGLGSPSPTEITSNGPFQIELSTGNVYFTTADEGDKVTLSVNGTVTQVVPTWISERTAAPIPIDQPANDNQVTAFLDPFDPIPFNLRRPSLVWLFWTSSRSGTSDVYFETMAPAWYPIPTPN